MPKALDFLIKVYTCLDSELEPQRKAIESELTQKSVALLKESQDEFMLVRIIDVIKQTIYESEKKGTGDVTPHSALLKGELLEKVTVKDKATNNKSVLSI